MQEEAKYFDINSFFSYQAVRFKIMLFQLNETGGGSYRRVLSEKVNQARVKALGPQRRQLESRDLLDYSGLLTCRASISSIGPRERGEVPGYGWIAKVGGMP